MSEFFPGKTLFVDEFFPGFFFEPIADDVFGDSLILIVMESVIHSFAIEHIGGFLHGVAIFYSVENHGRKYQVDFANVHKTLGQG